MGTLVGGWEGVGTLVGGWEGVSTLVGGWEGVGTLVGGWQVQVGSLVVGALRLCLVAGE